MGFIEDFIKYAEDLESPDEFIHWAAISTVAALLRDNVFFNVGYEHIFPNIYVILVGDSGSRKGPPIKISTRIIEDIGNTKCISGRGSIEGALGILRDVQTSLSGHKLTGGSGIIEAEEFTAYFTKSDQLIKILTDLYEYKKTYTYTLRDGNYTIKGICLTILGGSNEEFLKDIYSQSAMYGGLLARTFIIKFKKMRQPNSRMHHDAAALDARFQCLANKARRLAALKGEVVFDCGAKQLYHEWYLQWYERVNSNRNRAGVEARIHTGILKLALILAASEEQFDMVVRRHHVEDAIDLGLSLLPNYQSFGFASGGARYALQQNLVLQTLVKVGPPYVLKRKVLLRRNIGDLDPDVLDSVIDKFKQVGLVKETNLDGDLAYGLTDSCIESLLKAETARRGENAVS